MFIGELLNVMSNVNIPDMLIEVHRVTHKLYPSFVTAHNPQPLTDEVPVFMFHSVEPETFEEKLRFLKINNYQTITAAELYEFITNNTAVQSNSVLLTFDDGRECLAKVAYPLLREYGFKATAFIIPGCIDTKKQEYSTITWHEVEDMHKSGVMDFQSHTLFHNLDLTKISPDNEKEILDNFVKSKQLIEEHLPGKQVRHLCYPCGIGSLRSVELSKKAGYVSNFWVTVENKCTNRFRDDPYYVTRLKDDYIFRLPGKDRKSFLEIVKLKFVRRLSRKPLY